MRKKFKQHIILHLISSLILILSFTTISSSKTVPKLYFRKSIFYITKYKIKKGEYLYSILRRLGFPERSIPYFVKYIKKENPNIRNVDLLLPGTTIYIPKINLVKYKVKKGDCLVKLFKRIGKLPNYLIFNEYINLFKILNPHIKNINKLEVGKSIKIPIPSKKIAKQIKTQKLTFKENKVKASKIINKKVVKQKPNLNHPFFDTLTLAGFKVVTKRKIMLPKRDKSWWIEMDTSITPLITCPWGDSLLIIPKNLSVGCLDTVKQTGLPFCTCSLQNTHPSSLYNLFKELEKKFPNNILCWDKKRSVIVYTDQAVLELNADLQFVLMGKNLKKYYFFFYKKVQLTDNIVFYLKKLLSKYNVHIYLMANNLFEVIPPENIFIPTIPINELLGKKIKTVNLVLNLLDQKGYKLKMYIQLPGAYKNGTLDFLILNSKNVDPYLVALLGLKGYKCYLLKNE